MEILKLLEILKSDFTKFQILQQHICMLLDNKAVRKQVEFQKLY